MIFETCSGFRRISAFFTYFFMLSFFVPESKFGDIFETVDFSESGDITTVLSAERSEG